MQRFIILLFLIISIACNKLKEGTIVDKSWVPGYFINTTTYVGNTPLITLQYIPTTYVLIIKGKYNGKERIESWYTSEEYYNTHNIGQYIK